MCEKKCGLEGTEGFEGLSFEKDDRFVTAFVDGHFGELDDVFNFEVSHVVRRNGDDDKAEAEAIAGAVKKFNSMKQHYDETVEKWNNTNVECRPHELNRLKKLFFNVAYLEALADVVEDDGFEMFLYCNMDNDEYRIEGNARHGLTVTKTETGMQVVNIPTFELAKVFKAMEFLKNF